MIFKTLYKYNQFGSFQVWNVEVIDNKMYASIVVSFGQENGLLFCFNSSII